MRATRWAGAGLGTRRQFLQATAGGLVIAGHQGMIDAAGSQARPGEGARTSPIEELRLITSAPVAGMREFYGSRLGLPVTVPAPGRLAVQAGDSRIVFTHDAGADRPFYHFAFNIPENKIADARAWQLGRTPLLPIPARLRDARFPPDVVDYRHWNAHSIFFLDPGGNVVEYIARHDLRNARGGPFGPDDILCASEIGLVVDDVVAAAGRLRTALGMADYRGASDLFTPLGDEHGLLLVFKRGRVLDFRADGSEKAARVYPTGVTLRGSRAATVGIDGFPYQLVATRS